MKSTSFFLKAALFATGLAGIVSEYTLSTLATYFLGDSVFQWTMIVSIMLFSMGLGSRFSKRFEKDLLTKFIGIEFLLSCIASNVTVLVYTAFAIYGNPVFTIYFLSIVVGMLIGMEIPLVIRLNEQFESLKINISSSLENDYYGSLAGGAFFAFVGLPILGLTYTPLILGIVNFSVACLFIFIVRKDVEEPKRKRLALYGLLTAVLLATSGIFSKAIVRWGDHLRYQDRVVYSEQSRYQKIVITYGEGNYWLYLNGQQQLSTYDEELYHEPLVHSIMQLHRDPRKALVLGGGDGAAVRELLKYEDLEKITLVDLDPAVTNLAMNHAVLVGMNQNALIHDKVEVINGDGFTFLEEVTEKFDVIIADFPDPRTVDLGRLYTREFYWLCKNALNEDGMVITQAGSPYYAERAYECIGKTIEAAGFQTLKLHNQVPTLGEWGWILGAREKDRDLKMEIREAELGDIKTNWLTDEAFTLISSFGKEVLERNWDEVRVNRLHDPVLYKYYNKGRWDLY